MIGSTLGIVPGLVGITLLGSQLGELVTAESSREAVLALLGLLTGIGVLYGLKRWAERRRRR